LFTSTEWMLSGMHSSLQEVVTFSSGLVGFHVCSALEKDRYKACSLIEGSTQHACVESD
jgi:hypothetical protein